MDPEAYNNNKYASGVFYGKKSVEIGDDVSASVWNVSLWERKCEIGGGIK